MSLTSDQALERLLGSDRVVFTITRADEDACGRLLAEVLPRHVPPGAAEALAVDLAAKHGPVVVSDRWVRLWFLSWRLGP